MKIFILLTMIIIFADVGCVSVKLPTSLSAPEKAKGISVKAPTSPFKSSTSPNSDQMWISSKTASTISYFTSCSSTEPPLKNIRATAFSGLENVEVTKEDMIKISDREALKSDVEGKLEGVPVKIQLVIFKKNSCSYSLTYVALKENFEKELDQFTNFIKNFRVP